MAVRSFQQDGKIKANECEANTASAPDDVKAKAQELASSVVQKAQNVTSDVTNKVEDWAGNLADKAQETASGAVGKADAGIAAMGHQINALGESVRAAAPPASTLGSAASKIADELQAGGQYLEGHGLEAMGKDLTDVMRRHPLPAVLIGFGIGCFLGMAIFPRRS